MIVDYSAVSINDSVANESITRLGFQVAFWFTAGSVNAPPVFQSSRIIRGVLDEAAGCCSPRMLNTFASCPNIASTKTVDAGSDTRRGEPQSISRLVPSAICAVGVCEIVDVVPRGHDFKSHIALRTETKGI
jgi:hypothetical protein